MIPLLDRNRKALPKDSPKAKSRVKPKVSPGQLASVKIEQFKEFLRTKSLEAAIPQDFKRNGVQLVKYERIGGMTNKNYKVLMGTEVLVLRLPGRGTGRFINRSHERTNQAAAARAGFTPPALYFNQFTGVKVSSFLQEASIFSPETACLPENYLQLAKVLRIFHDSPIRFSNTFNGFSMSRVYERVARSRFEPFYAGYKDMQARIRCLERILKSIAVPLRACHNDLVPENILVVDGRMQFIDWEYSGMNDPAWDVASFLLESELDSEATHSFIATYLSDADGSPEFMFRVRGYQVLQDFLWSLWSLMYSSANRNSDRGSFFRSYGEQRFARSCSSLDTLESVYAIPIRDVSL